jgi:glycosyltransferase involved in cell wall biosynthesis
VLYVEPSKFGSMEEFAVCLSRALRDRGWESVLAFSKPVGQCMLPYFTDCGATLTSFRVRERFGYYPDIVKLLRSYKPDIVHFHFFNQFSMLPIVARGLGPKRLIFTDHVRQPVRVGALTRLECRVWDRIVLPLTSARVIAVSEHIKKTLTGFFEMRPSRILVHYNGVNIKRFNRGNAEDDLLLRREFNIPAEASVVLSASNLRPEKGLSDLLKAARLVISREPRTCFVIVGEGPVAGQLKWEAEELRITENVRFTGSRSDVQRLMALSSVVVVPSTWQEPAGLVEVEAMACGRPVVATRVGGIPEYVEDGVTGILVRPSSPSDLASAILQILAAPKSATEMGAAGRLRVESRFSLDRWVADTVDLYESSLLPSV